MIALKKSNLKNRFFPDASPIKRKQPRRTEETNQFSKKLIFLVAVLSLMILSGCAKVKLEEQKMKIAIIETEKGSIKFQLYEIDAPITVKNFIDLANSKFYDGLTFHRVEPGFVIQGGDPQGDGTGGSENSIQLEIPCEDGTAISGKVAPASCIPKLRHVFGAVGMARTNEPNSATSQFYITLSETPFLDRNYAVFGKVIEGMDVAEKIKAGDKMNKVTISNG